MTNGLYIEGPVKSDYATSILPSWLLRPITTVGVSGVNNAAR